MKGLSFLFFILFFSLIFFGKFDNITLPHDLIIQSKSNLIQEKKLMHFEEENNRLKANYVFSFNKDKKPISNNLFFIWIGYEISQQSLKNIEIFANINASNYKTSIYTDNVKQMKKAIEKYGIDNANITIKDISKEISKSYIDSIGFSGLNNIIEYFYGHTKYSKHFMPAVISDILRQLILYKEGGLYLDVDFIFKDQPVKFPNPKDIIPKYGFNMNCRDNSGTKNNNNIMAAIPKSELIRKNLANISINTLENIEYNKQRLYSTAAAKSDIDIINTRLAMHIAGPVAIEYVTFPLILYEEGIIENLASGIKREEILTFFNKKGGAPKDIYRSQIRDNKLCNMIAGEIAGISENLIEHINSHTDNDGQYNWRDINLIAPRR